MTKSDVDCECVDGIGRDEKEQTVGGFHGLI